MTQGSVVIDHLITGADTTITLGQVTTGRKIRLHANIDGAAPCASGRGKILHGTEVELTKASAHRACRTRACRNAIRTQIEAAQDANDLRAMSTGRLARENQLIRLADRFATSAQVASRAAFAADHVTQIAERPEGRTSVEPVVTAPVQAANPPLLDLADAELARPLSGWGALVVAHGTTPQAAALAHAARRLARGGRKQGPRPTFAPASTAA